MNHNTKENTVAMFHNEDRTPENNKPLFRAIGNWNGEEFEMSLWPTESKGEGKMPAGTKFWSGQIKEKWVKDAAPKQQAASSPPVADMDSIPF